MNVQNKDYVEYAVVMLKALREKPMSFFDLFKVIYKTPCPSASTLKKRGINHSTKYVRMINTLIELGYVKQDLGQTELFGKEYIYTISKAGEDLADTFDGFVDIISLYRAKWEADANEIQNIITKEVG
jgi:hypothetical protein